MVLVLAVLPVALAVGWLAGGSLARLGTVPLRHARLAVAAVAAQLLGTLVGGPAHAVGLVVSVGCAAAFLLVNRGLRGLGLVALGLGANALVVGLNGAMPVSAAALERIGHGPAVDGPRHELAGDGTRLRPLGDVVPVPLPLVPVVVSPGDVLVAAGVAQAVVAGMLRPRRPVPRVRRLASRAVPTTGEPHGEEGPQAPRAQEERREPRQAPERLTSAGVVPEPPAGPRALDHRAQVVPGGEAQP